MYCAKKIAGLLDGRGLKPYPLGLGTDRASDIIAVSLGRYDGVLVWNSIIIRGCLVALVKWFIEYTQVLQAADEPIGVLVWYLAHPITFWVDKYGCCLRRRSSSVRVVTPTLNTLNTPQVHSPAAAQGCAAAL
jgi:hypothetical protein